MITLSITQEISKYWSWSLKKMNIQAKQSLRNHLVTISDILAQE